MEFKEFTNPEEKDYDINSSYNELNEQSTNYQNPYEEKLIELLGGFLEDFTEEELIRDYGITLKEYYSPTKETIDKVSNKLGITKTNRRR